MKSMGRERGWPGYSCTEGLEAGEPERWSESWEERERRGSGHWPGVQAARGVSTMGLRRQVDPHRMKVPLDWSLPFSRLGLLSFENTEQTTLTCELHGLQPHWDPQISEQGCSRPWSVLPLISSDTISHHSTCFSHSQSSPFPLWAVGLRLASVTIVSS